MKRKFLALAALIALLICALGGAVLAEEPAPTPKPEDTMTTQAKIEFTEAIFFYEFTEEDDDVNGMDIDYGEQELPIGVETFIPADDGDHTLRVCDRRLEGGKWDVSAVMTDMTSEDDERFTAELQLYSPTVSDGITATIVGSGETERVAVNTSSAKVVEAADELVPGDFDLTTLKANTKLRIAADQALLVKPLIYTGTVTWTLTIAP